MSQMNIFLALIACAAALVGGWQLRGWSDAKKANRKSQLLDELADDVAEIESYRDDNSAAQAKRVQDKADAEKLAVLKERIAALS